MNFISLTPLPKYFSRIPEISSILLYVELHYLFDVLAANAMQVIRCDVMVRHVAIL